MTPLPTLGLIGAGRMGGALGRAYHAAGGRVSAVSSRTIDTAAALAAAVAAAAVPDALAVVRAAELTVIAVPDDQIAAVVQELAAADLTGCRIVHTSGAADAAMLTPLAERGAITGGLHPAYPVATGTQPLPPGVTYGLEAADPVLLDSLGAIVRALDGVPLVIAPGGKPLYHAALVFASNYGVTLYALARDLLGTIAPTADAAALDGALLALVRGMVDNLARHGLPAALTGPLVRGDTGTIARHAAALTAADPALADLYAALARATVPLLIARGLSADQVRALLAALEPP